MWKIQVQSSEIGCRPNHMSYIERELLGWICLKDILAAFHLCFLPVTDIKISAKIFFPLNCQIKTFAVSSFQFTALS